MSMYGRINGGNIINDGKARRAHKPERKSVNGPVRTYFLTEEELAHYRAIPPPKPEFSGNFKQKTRY